MCIFGLRCWTSVKTRHPEKKKKGFQSNRMKLYTTTYFTRTGITSNVGKI